MKNIRLVMWVAVSMVFGSAAWAADQSAHHPDASASSGAQSGMMPMGGSMGMMMDAKTPEERETMMMGHQKMMRGCMSMMDMMHRDMDKGETGKMRGGMLSEMMERNKKMEQKMERMERMMKMMMDRLPPAVKK